MREFYESFQKELGTGVARLLLLVLTAILLTGAKFLPVDRTATRLILLCLSGCALLLLLVSLSFLIWRVRIYKAVYATCNVAKDVTEVVRKKVEEQGVRNIPVTNEFLLGPDKDIQFGMPKTLTVEYVKFGRKRTKKAQEFDRLQL
ncbi:MAG: hypothetical protein ABSA69_07090 [Verrucomicrobiota bacterium]|jgi:hypothetical protein